MQEREFQNLFIFHPGFEAASLKRPSCNYAASSPTEVDPLLTPPALSAGVHLLHQSHISLQLPVTSDSSDFANNPNNSNNNLAVAMTTTTSKKPIIGFAKFRTRDDAAKAIEVLNGRKLDTESSVFLKVEMARKNLVTKRSNPATNNHAIAVNNADSVNALPVASNIYSSFDSVATSAASNVSHISSCYDASLSPSAPLYSLASWRPSLASPDCSSASSASGFSNHTRRSSSDLSDLDSLDSLNGGGCVNNNSNSSNSNDVFRSLPPQFSALGRSKLDPPPLSTPPVVVSDNSHSSKYFGSSDQREELKTLEDEILFKLQAPVKKMPFFPDPSSLAFSVARATSFQELNGRTEQQQQQKVSAIPLQQRSVTDMFGLPGQYPTNTLLQSPISSTIPAMISIQQQKNSPLPAPPVNTRGSNVTTVPDQNPPCNTLYVGNLPPDTQETELRNLFAGAPGFKRMCFKPKPGNGPMCFVEFEDANMSTMALNELQGSLLSNSARGGIRISYSKNPLGVRQVSPTLNSQGDVPSLPNEVTLADFARRSNSHGPSMPLAAVKAEPRSFSLLPSFEQGIGNEANRLNTSRSIPQLRVDTSIFGQYQQQQQQVEKESPKPLLSSNNRINSLLVQALHNRANNESQRAAPRSASNFGAASGGVGGTSGSEGGGNKPFMSAWFSQTMIKG